MRDPHFAPYVVLLALLTLSCAQGELGDPCDGDDDCKGALACDEPDDSGDRTCRAELGAPCGGDEDCLTDLVCDEHEAEGTCQEEHDH